MPFKVKTLWKKMITGKENASNTGVDRKINEKL